MIISFSVSNFRSFNDEVTFSMVASNRFQDHPNHLGNIPDSNAKVLRAGVIYGANGSGKSNFVRALRYLNRLAIGTRNKDAGTGRNTFLFVEDSSKNSSLDIQFISDGKTYRYGMEIDDTKIVNEWLVLVNNERESIIFERTTTETGSVSVDAKELSNENEKICSLINVGGPQNQTFLATIASTLNVQDYGAHLSSVIRWFENSLQFVYPNIEPEYFEREIFEKNGLSEFINNFLAFSSTGLDRLDVTREEITEDKLKTVAAEIYPELSQEKNNYYAYYSNKKLGKAIFVSNENGRHYYMYSINAVHEHETGKAVSTNLRDESDGTNRLIRILPALFDLQNNKNSCVYVIDEIDRSMHPLLVLKFIEFFLSGCAGSSSQLIVTTHDTHILDSDLVRRDEVWFTEKDEHGATKMYSLSDFQPRSDLKLGKNYLLGRFGAIPYLGRIDALIHAEQSKQA